MTLTQCLHSRACNSHFLIIKQLPPQWSFRCKGRGWCLHLLRLGKKTPFAWELVPMHISCGGTHTCNLDVSNNEAFSFLPCLVIIVAEWVRFLGWQALRCPGRCCHRNPLTTDYAARFRRFVRALHVLDGGWSRWQPHRREDIYSLWQHAYCILKVLYIVAV